MYVYIGKCSDGNFYWIVYYTNPVLGVTNIHIHRRARINGVWRSELFLSGLEKIKAVISALPREVASVVKKLINSISGVGRAVSTVDFREFVDVIEYTRDVVRSVKKLLDALEVRIREHVSDARVAKVFRRVMDDLMNMWRRELSELSSKWELSHEVVTPYTLLDDVERELSNILNKLGV